MKSRGLVFGGRYLPYNQDLQDRAPDMRKNMTSAEQQLWDKCLREYNKRWPSKITILKQKVIDNYIVDFYIPKYNLVIELDWESHENRAEYDCERTKVLQWYWLTEMRFNNSEMYNNFDAVCEKIQNYIQKNVLAPL